MSYTSKPQFTQNIFFRQPNGGDLGKTHGDVGQDKIGQAADRETLAQPEWTAVEMRSAPEIPPALAHCRSRVPVTAHVRPEVKAELERLARQGNGKGEALSLSQTAAALLEQGIQGHIDMQYGALLRPVIEAAIKNEVQSFANRSASLTVNAFYAAEQARILCITIASLLLGEQTDVLPGIVAECQKQAHANLGRNLWREQEGEEG